MTVKIILAIDKGNSIGWQDGRLPWKIKSDMHRFKALTTGHVILMGSKTAATLPASGLPNRKNVILTRDISKQTLDNVNPQIISGAGALSSFVRGYNQASQDLWIIGGAQIYCQALEQNLADEIHITVVDAVSNADVRLQGYPLTDWRAFVAQQQERGITWKVVEAEINPATSQEPGTTYMRLVKQ